MYVLVKKVLIASSAALCESYLNEAMDFSLSDLCIIIGVD